LNYGLGKVLSYDETGFLGREDYKYTRQAWNFMLSGGGVFDHLDYSFSAGHEDGRDLEANGPGGGSPELRKRLRILSEFLKGLPLLEMHPDFGVVKQAGGVVAHALLSGSGEYAIYLDGNGPTQIVLNLPRGEYDLTWIDVAGGGKKEAAFHHDGGERTIDSPQFKNGIAMRLRKK
jgi:hypothetical protein